MTYAYDGTSALVSGIAYEGADGSTLYSQNYTYDTLGQLTGETNNLYSWTYQYDTFGNILSVKENNKTHHTFTYGEVIGALLADFSIDFMPELGLFAIDTTVKENAQTRQENAATEQSDSTNDTYYTPATNNTKSGRGRSVSNRVVCMM